MHHHMLAVYISANQICWECIFICGAASARTLTHIQCCCHKHSMNVPRLHIFNFLFSSSFVAIKSGCYAPHQVENVPKSRQKHLVLSQKTRLDISRCLGKNVLSCCHKHGWKMSTFRNVETEPGLCVCHAAPPLRWQSAQTHMIWMWYDTWCRNAHRLVV